jgi:hypothetical protein
VVGTWECGNEPSGAKNAGNFFTSCKPVRFSRSTLLHRAWGIVKIKAKVTLEQATKAQRGSKGIALLFPHPRC